MAFYEVDELKRAASGRWVEILVAAGLPASRLERPNQPCPKCGGKDRFSAFPDLNERGAVHCRRCFTRGCVISPTDGIATLRWWLGCSFSKALEFLADALGVRARDDADSSFATSSYRRGFSAGRPLRQETAAQDASAIERQMQFARAAYQRMTPTTRQRLANHLCVSGRALESLRVGIDSDFTSSTWPMRNARGQVIGVRLTSLPWTKSPTKKWSRLQSRNGLFVPRQVSERAANPNRIRVAPGSGVLDITEGASDTAAAVTLGSWVIGRASCSSASAFVARYIQMHQPHSVRIIADRDQAGIAGAKQLAHFLCETLARGLSEIRVIVPPEPFGDLRDWFAAGANLDSLKDASEIFFERPLRQATFDFA